MYYGIVSLDLFQGPLKEVCKDIRKLLVLNETERIETWIKLSEDDLLVCVPQGTTPVSNSRLRRRARIDRSTGRYSCGIVNRSLIAGSAIATDVRTFGYGLPWPKSEFWRVRIPATS